MIPTIFPDDQKELFPGNLNPEKAKQKLAEGYRIKLMNDFVYNQVIFTHYVLEKGV